MSRITIAGLGPGAPGLRTIETAAAIDAASVIVLRTSIHPGIEDLTSDRRVVACDDLYETGRTFDEVYASIATRVVEIAATSDVLYLMPGHPFYGERVSPLILATARERGHDCTVLSAVSAFDVVATALEIDLMVTEPQSIDATTLAHLLEQDSFAAGMLELAPTRPLLVTQVFSPEMATATKLVLASVYPEDHEIVVLRGAGLETQTIERMPLHRLDRASVDHLTTVWVDPLDPLESMRTPSSLLRIAARLRAPGGCPWDREQTAESLLPSLLEEAYEVVDAIQSGDSVHVSEELGDLFLHVVMQSQIAEEEELFTFNDVAEGITTKLIRRHPHVFGDLAANDSDEVLGLWQRIKAAERAESGKPERPAHPLDRYPASMPIARRLHDHLPSRAVENNEETSLALGDHLFEATRAAIAAGYDPERLLLDAAKRAIPLPEQESHSAIANNT